jgi:hypothetical protein
MHIAHGTVFVNDMCVVHFYMFYISICVHMDVSTRSDEKRSKLISFCFFNQTNRPSKAQHRTAPSSVDLGAHATAAHRGFLSNLDIILRCVHFDSLSTGLVGGLGIHGFNIRHWPHKAKISECVYHTAKLCTKHMHHLEVGRLGLKFAWQI